MVRLEASVSAPVARIVKCGQMVVGCAVAVSFSAAADEAAAASFVDGLEVAAGAAACVCACICSVGAGCITHVCAVGSCLKCRCVCPVALYALIRPVLAISYRIRCYLLLRMRCSGWVNCFEKRDMSICCLGIRKGRQALSCSCVCVVSVGLAETAAQVVTQCGSCVHHAYGCRGKLKNLKRHACMDGTATALLHQYQYGSDVNLGACRCCRLQLSVAPPPQCCSPRHLVLNILAIL